MEFLDSSIFLPETMVHVGAQDVLTPDTFSFGCFHCSISSVKTSSLTKLAKGQGASTAEAMRLIFCSPHFGYHGSPTEVGGWFLYRDVIFVWISFMLLQGFLSCESASWSSRVASFGTTPTLLKLQNHQDNMHHGSNNNHCSVSWRAKRGQTSWIGWYSLKRNHAAAAIQRWSSAIFCHRVSQAEVVSVVGSNI